MHCKKCLHYEVCVKLGKPSLYGINQEIGCSAYKDKTKWVGNKFDECDYKGCPYRTEQITNADRIRSMNDEELAEFLSARPNDDFYEWPDLTLQWLQQPAEGTDHEQ